MTLDDQKEATAKAICLYVADQIESKKVDMKGASRLMSFLVSGMEGAENSADLKKLPGEVKQIWASLPAFHLGL